MVNGEERVENFLQGVQSAPVSVLLLDYDGTLAPFSVNRDRAVPYAGVVELLQCIVDAGRTRLVIVTGRDAHEVGPLLGLLPSPEVWGVHGLQRLRPDGTCEVLEIPPRVSRTLTDAVQWLSYQGLEDLAEIKPGSIAVHWRNFEEAEASGLRSRVLLGWFRIAARGSLKLQEFDGGVEMRMAGLDKGEVVKTILGEVDPDVPVAYLGDDTTDEAAFRALAQRGLTVLVRPMRRRTSAQVWMQAPDGLRHFLLRWERAIEGAAQAPAVSP